MTETAPNQGVGSQPMKAWPRAVPVTLRVESQVAEPSRGQRHWEVQVKIANEVLHVMLPWLLLLSLNSNPLAIQ